MYPSYRIRVVNTMQKPSYYRSRIELIESNLKQADKENSRFWRNGHVPSWLSIEFEIEANTNSSHYNDESLGDIEKTSYSTWFEMHPEKMAGVEIETTSRDFPLKIKGNKKEIEILIRNTIETFEAEAIAVAMQMELELLTIKK